MVLLKVIITPIFLPKNADLGDWDRITAMVKRTETQKLGPGRDCQGHVITLNRFG